MNPEIQENSQIAVEDCHMNNRKEQSFTLLEEWRKEGRLWSRNALYTPY